MLRRCMWNEFTIERGATLDDLARVVRKMMKHGWQPVGGICIDIHEDQERFLQSMVRFRELEV